MRELLEGRRLGFALRPVFADAAVGLALGLFLLDLVSWTGWGVRDTNALVVASVWLGVAIAFVSLLSLATALAERADAPEEDASLARTDAIAVTVAVVLYVATTAARAADTGAAAASPLALILELAGLVVLIAGAALASTLYASREWEEVEEFLHERQRRKRAAGR